jgi:hypothetical protein
MQWQEGEAHMLHPEVTPLSQTNRLRGALAGHAITHGQTVRGDIERVEVSGKILSRMLLFFCHMRGVRIRHQVQPGDGGTLPADVVVHGLEVEREGVYDIRNALITSNGRIEVTIDRESRVIPSDRSLIRRLLNV